MKEKQTEPPSERASSPLAVESDLVERLADASDPALRAKVLTDLLDYSPGHRDVVAARERIPEQPWVRATLAAHHGDGTWGRGFYHKYDGTSWVLLHLSEIGAQMDLPPVRTGVRRLIDTARPVQAIKGARGQPFTDLQHGVYWKHPIVCLTAHMALVLIRAGLPDHPTTRAALNICRHRFEPHRGFGCFVLDESLLPACVMTVPKVLKAFLALPRESRTKEDRELIDGMVGVLKRFHLYRYVPREAPAWRQWARKASTEDKREASRRWAADGRLEPRAPKESWLRFSFPHGYDSDLLEVLLVIGEANPSRDDVVDAGLEILRSKRGRTGMWSMVGGLNGRMHGRLDRKGRPSPWITYRSLLAFKRFGLLKLP